MNIRKATEHDIEAIMELNRLLNKQHVLMDSIWVSGDAVNASFKEIVTTEIHKPSFCHLVAEEHGKIVGWFAGSIEDTPPYYRDRKIGHIRNAYVLPEFRKRGIAKASMDRMFEWFKEKGATLAELSVASGNEEGLTAWENLGFVEYKKRMKREI